MAEEKCISQLISMLSAIEPEQIRRHFTVVVLSGCQLYQRERLLVFPAASKPSINNLISFDPKILASIFDTPEPMFAVIVEEKVTVSG